jgi:hypothetical protein
VASPEFDAHGRTHRSVEVGIVAESAVKVPNEHDAWLDDAFDSTTNKIVLGIGAAGLVGIATTLAIKRLQQRNKE